FPKYMVDAQELPKVVKGDLTTTPPPFHDPTPFHHTPDDPADPEPHISLEQVPLKGVLDIPHHDRIFADVMAGFRRRIRGVSEASVDALREFIGEGNFRSNLPMMEGGSVASPTLYTNSGKALGYFRFEVVDYRGGDTLTGPTMKGGSRLESNVLRALRTQNSTTISSSLGGSVAPSLGFGKGKADKATGYSPAGGTVNPFKFGMVHQAAHALNYGARAYTSRALRLVHDLLHTTPTMQLRVTFVRPDGRAVGPRRGTPLVGGKGYPVNMLVPPKSAMGHKPTKNERQYLPAHLLHLEDLGLTVTPLQVKVPDTMFTQLEQFLRKQGFLPPDVATPGMLDSLTQDATDTQRLNNVRKLDHLRSRMGLLSTADEMIQGEIDDDGKITGGTEVTFVKPTPTGSERITVNLLALRRYSSTTDRHRGVSHDWVLPEIQTMNYTGAVLPGGESDSKTPRGWNLGLGGQATNPLSAPHSEGLASVAGSFTYSSSHSKVEEYDTGFGEENYTFSPGPKSAQPGNQIFSVPTHMWMKIHYSHGASPAAVHDEGSYHLAVPTYLTDKVKRATSPSPPPTVRDVDPTDATDPDIRRLAVPGPGHSLVDGVMKLPQSAVIGRHNPSKTLIKVVNDLIRRAQLEAAAASENGESDGDEDRTGVPVVTGTAAVTDTPVTDTPVTPKRGGSSRRTTRMPGAFEDLEDDPEDLRRDKIQLRTRKTRRRTEDPTSPKILLTNPEGEQEDIAPPDFRVHSDSDSLSAGTSDDHSSASSDRIAADAGSPGWTEMGKALAKGAMHWVVDPLTGVGKWVWRTNFGEPTANPESMGQSVVHTSLSTHHMSSFAPLIFRDSYKFEVETPGSIAGSDYTVEITGYLDDVEVLDPAAIDTEHWLESTNASSHTESEQKGHQSTFSTGGRYGEKSDPSFNPVGAYQHNRTKTTHVTNTDTTDTLRVTSDYGGNVHRLRARAHYLVTLKVGTRNVASGVLPEKLGRGLHLRDTRSRMVDAPQAMEIFLTDNDLHANPDLMHQVQQAYAKRKVPVTIADEQPADRKLPDVFFDKKNPGKNNLLGFGATTEVEFADGRSAYDKTVVDLVEKIAPGATKSGSANYHPGLLSRINQQTTSFGTRTLPNAGSEGKASIHFIHRHPVFGPRLVEIN
ncbi:hypothetical protein, partial [Nocardia alni]|uniref:hypothetical protein n=1 Tax=Nocardia alni TaxID=2815723 RepID=UPI001C21B35A